MLLAFTDASWQDCIDTGHSTGSYKIYLQGAVVDAASFLPVPIAMSSAQAEYTAASTSVMAIDHVQQVVQEVLCGQPDMPLTVPLYCDSSSAIAMANSGKDTQATRHIARRIHHVRQATALNEIQLLKISGNENPADMGTKNLDGPQLRHLLPLVHVYVDS